MAYVNGTFFCIVGVSAGDNSAVASVYGGTVVWVGPFYDGTYKWRPSGLTQQLHFKVSGVNTAVKPALYNLKSGETTSIEISGLSPETDYNFIVTGIGGETKYYPFRTGKAGEGPAGPPDTASYIGPGSAGSGEVGPYPIDDNNYEGKTGTQQGIHWPSGNGYYWAKIDGTGHKLYDKATDTPDTSHLTRNGYYPNAHGTGEWVSIELEGDCWFSRCSGFRPSYSVLSTNSAVGTDPSGPYASYGGNPQNRMSGDFCILNASSDSAWWSDWWNHYNTTAESGIDGTAAWGAGRKSYTVTLKRPATADSVETYYCKQSLGCKFGYSVAEIQFTIPRLDPFIKAVSNNTTWGSVYFLIANGYNSDGYTYDSTHYTERYVPVGTHIKLVAVPTSIGKFNKYTPGNITTLEYELDVTDDTTYTANFELGQFEIKVAKGNDNIISVSKTPSHSEGLAENWYLPNTEITIDAELKPSSDVAYYTFDSWKIGDEIVFNNKRNTFRANRSGTYTAYGKASNLKYKVIYSPWECSASIKNEVSGAIGDAVLAELGERLTLSCTPTSNYILKGWKQRLDENHDWEDLNSPSIIAGNYRYFMPVLEPDGAECQILSPDEFNSIAQPIYQKGFKDYSKLVGVNQRWIGTKDPNSINWEEIKEQGLTWDRGSELGDFFFMKKGGE